MTEADYDEALDRAAALQSRIDKAVEIGRDPWPWKEGHEGDPNYDINGRWRGSSPRYAD